MAVDGQLVARTVGELRAMLAEAGDLLGGFQRVVDATRTVVGVDGVGLTLAHEDGPPRWVATTDRAMELLEQIQQDFGEGPCLAAYAEDRVVAVEDLGRAPRWDRIAAVVVGQLQVRGMVSVPVRLAGQPVGTLDAYTTNPRAWSAQEMDALGALAAVTADLIHTGAELAAREIEVAQLRQALVGRVWIEQAKGVLAGTRGSALMRRSSGSANRRGRPAASWPTWPERSSRTPNASGSPPWPSTTPGSGPPRPAPERPSRRCGQPRPGWPAAPQPRIGRRTPPMPESGPPTSATTSPRNGTASPTNANRPLTHVTGPPTTPRRWSVPPKGPARAVPAAPSGSRPADLGVTAQPSPPKQVGSGAAFGGARQTGQLLRPDGCASGIAAPPAPPALGEPVASIAGGCTPAPPLP